MRFTKYKKNRLKILNLRIQVLIDSNQRCPCIRRVEGLNKSLLTS